MNEEGYGCVAMARRGNECNSWLHIFRSVRSSSSAPINLTTDSLILYGYSNFMPFLIIIQLHINGIFVNLRIMVDGGLESFLRFLRLEWSLHGPIVHGIF